MPTFFSSDALDNLLRFAVDLGSAARLFTSQQLARHADLSWYHEPERRAREFLRMHRDTFERLSGPRHEHVRWRLTRAARQRYGVTHKPVPAMTERAYHWLGLGDIWCELTFHGGRPTEWRTEVDRQFDVMCMWRGKLLLIEYQRTPVTAKMWAKKWTARKAWYKAQTWEQRPIILLVNTTGQQDETVQAPRGTVHVRRIEEIHRVVR
ncbi:MAG: hypothetical protein K6T83_21455 [Alicyclobacillus sp.]|nr:hypothetical protein [Alicyclobacillus sp.]